MLVHLGSNLVLHLRWHHAEDHDPQSLRHSFEARCVLIQILFPRGQVLEQDALVLAFGKAGESLKASHIDDFGATAILLLQIPPELEAVILVAAAEFVLPLIVEVLVQPSEGECTHLDGDLPRIKPIDGCVMESLFRETDGGIS